MKVQRLLLGTLAFLYCNISRAEAEESSKIICEKGIFPNQSPEKESMIPLTEENDLDDSTSQPYDIDPNKDQNVQPLPNQNLERPNQTPSGNSTNPNVKNYGME